MCNKDIQGDMGQSNSLTSLWLSAHWHRDHLLSPVFPHSARQDTPSQLMALVNTFPTSDRNERPHNPNTEIHQSKQAFAECLLEAHRAARAPPSTAVALLSLECFPCACGKESVQPAQEQPKGKGEHSVCVGLCESSSAMSFAK